MEALSAAVANIFVALFSEMKFHREMLIEQNALCKKKLF